MDKARDAYVDFDHTQNNKVVPNLTVGYDFHVCHFESS